MSKRKLIYSKRFPVEPELEEEMKNENNIQKHEPRYDTGKGFLEHLLNDSVYVPNPERLKRKNIFIKRVVEFSQAYEMDTDIEDCKGHLSATIYIIPCLFASEQKEMFNGIVRMADDISFFLTQANPDKIIISLSYYTHDHYISGRKIRSLS